MGTRGNSAGPGMGQGTEGGEQNRKALLSSKAEQGDTIISQTRSPGWAWWLMPENPALRKTKADRSLEVRSLRPAWQ